MLGKSVGPYQILEKIGAGGMGEVFLGHDPRLERRVALKCLTSAASTTADGHTRVLREARAVARLTHPHIAGVYDVLEQDGRTFIVMEYVEGVSLAAHLAGGPLPAAEVRLIGRQLASALAAAHAQGVIHRDLKPANIQVMRDGSIKVLDFGVAKLVPSMMTAIDTTIGDAPHSLGGNPGTPLYMAPEQLIGHIADARSDLYSAGVILFQMATGRRPYLETTAVTLALAMSADAAPSAREINPLVPLELSEAIARALKRNPDHRYQSARELDSALASISGTASATRAVNTAGEDCDDAPPVLSTRLRWTLAAVAAVLLAGGIIARGPLMARLGVGATTAVAGRSVVLAILPVDNPTGDPQAGYLAAAMTSVVAANFRALEPVKVLPRDATVPFAHRRGDWSAMKAAFGSGYVLDLTIRRGGLRPEVAAVLRTTDTPAPAWQRTLTGSPVDMAAALLDGVGGTLSHRAWWRPSMLSADEWARLRRLPTDSAAAATAYAEASALLDRTDLPDNSRRAVDRLQSAVDVDRNFAPGYAALGVALLGLYEKTKDGALVERATGAVNEALRLNATLGAAHYASGYLQYVTGRREDAVASLQRAIQIDPDSDAAHRLLGRLLSQQGRTDDAVAELRQAVSIAPDSFENHYRLGTVLYLGGRYDEAAASYRKATEIQPMRADAYTNLGAAYQMLGDVNQAIGNYEHAVRLGAGDALAYGNLAVTYFMAGRNENALDASLEAVKRDPNRASLQRDLGDYLSSLGRAGEARAAYSRAIAQAQRSLAVNPRDVAAVMIVALCEAHLGNRVEAARRVAEALALAPDDRDILLRSAKAYLILGDRRASLERLRMAIGRGYNPVLAREDPEFSSLKSSLGFEEAIAAGVRARPGAGAPQSSRAQGR